MEDEKRNKTIDKPWLFKKGNPGSPGRPKGKSLKEYSRDYLASLTDEERQEFLEGIPKESIWKMAEGNPENNTDLTSKGEKLDTILVKFLDAKDDRNTNGISEIV